MRGVWAARGLAGLDLPAACPPCGSIPLRTDFSVLRGLPPAKQVLYSLTCGFGASVFAQAAFASVLPGIKIAKRENLCKQTESPF